MVKNKKPIYLHCLIEVSFRVVLNSNFKMHFLLVISKDPNPKKPQMEENKTHKKQTPDPQNLAKSG